MVYLGSRRTELDAILDPVEEGRAAQRSMEKDLRRESTSPGCPSPGPEFRDKTRELMQQGEDYFRAGLYQQAVNVWTRILFLDRGNIAAREAIEGAKRAIAERQRRLDATVAEATRLIDTGERRRARHAVSWVLARDPRHSEGRALRERLDGLERRGERAAQPRQAEDEPLPRARPPRPERSPAKPLDRASPLKMAVFLFSALCVFAAGGLYLHLNWDFLVNDPLFEGHDFSRQPLLTGREVPPPPKLDDLYYFNGARLYAKGRYREALAELARVGRQSSRTEQARNLILRIEERLLRDGSGGMEAPTASERSRAARPAPGNASAETRF